VSLSPGERYAAGGFIIAGAVRDVMMVDAYLDEKIFNLYLERLRSQ
jgi:hypothetical protein